MNLKLMLGLILGLSLGARILRGAPGDAKAGQPAYTKSCGTCHGPQGEPKPAIAKMMKVDMKHLGAKEVQTKSDDQLKKDILSGTGKMVAVKGLDDKLAGDVIAFVRTLAQK